MVVFTFFVIDWETLFLGKYFSENQNCQFKFKFGTWTNSNIQNSMALFTFPYLDRKKHFLGKFGPRN